VHSYGLGIDRDTAQRVMLNAGEAPVAPKTAKTSER
jgi:hypothetical protein